MRIISMQLYKLTSTIATMPIFSLIDAMMISNLNYFLMSSRSYMHLTNLDTFFSLHCDNVIFFPLNSLLVF